MARETPVVPAVYSTTVPPGGSLPSAAARSTMAWATRSFILPVGLADSSFATTRAEPDGTRRRSSTRGVLPMASRTCFDVCILYPALTGRVPGEGVARAIQDVSAPRANRHDCCNDRSIESVRRHSREKLPVDRDDAHLTVLTAKVEASSSDCSLEAGDPLLRTRRVGECDKGLRTQAETGESVTAYRKAIAWDVVPFGIRLKRWLGPLYGRWWWRLFRGRPGR